MQLSAITELATGLGINGRVPWLFMQYDTWGGELDFVFGLGVTSAGPFGPFEESARGQVEPIYINLMSQLGVGADEALEFEPFKRGYWGEQ